MKENKKCSCGGVIIYNPNKKRFECLMCKHIERDESLEDIMKDNPIMETLLKATKSI